ncbi:hypothetical protein LTR37_020807 [Vermiconidia calcicola]|uniref:Uncharacterized protein n=1 Tax=Vermiconidia calcicola TaxID=1690605 RepID=A0ACC3MBQ5_9PEZI|nr:hypothetical protein LTR37_020807 [Vermiconidia calcicola]
MVQVIADMFFLHERGFWMGAYFTMYFSGAFLSPIASGNIAARYGWRSFFWLTVALATFATVLLVFAFPETKWHRETINHSGGKDIKSDGNERNANGSDASSEAGAGGPAVGKGKPGKRQFLTVQKPGGPFWRHVIRDLTMPVIVFFNTIILWSALMLAGPADLFLLFSLTQSGLPALIPFVCFFVISHIVGAVGYTHAWPWEVIITRGFGFSGLAVTSIPAISITYALDCYKPVAGEIMVVGTVMKNVLGFCLSYSLPQTSRAFGQQHTLVYLRLDDKTRTAMPDASSDATLTQDHV